MTIFNFFTLLGGLALFLFGMQVSLFHHRDLPALSASYLLPCPGMPSLTALFFTASATAGARALPAPDPGLSRLWRAACPSPDRKSKDASPLIPGQGFFQKRQPTSRHPHIFCSPRDAWEMILN